MNVLPRTTLPTLPWTPPRGDCFPAPRRIEALAGRFAPISLKQMDSVALLDRVDTKYVLTTGQLLAALEVLQPDYWMLAVGGQRLNHYRSLYFDTPAFDLYTDHVNGRAERYKVRSREYSDSNLSFIEVKHKTRKDRTLKQRISTDRPVMRLTPEITRWLASVSPLDGARLEPKLCNTFTRLTLVSKRCCERLTLDIDLAFYNAEYGAQLDGIAIAEVKMEGGGEASVFARQMRDGRVRPFGFSKYAIGVSLLYGGVKKNALKPKMLWIKKMMKETTCND